MPLFLSSLCPDAQLNQTTAPCLCMGHNMVLKSAHESKPIRRAAGAESPTFAFHSATGAEKMKRSFFLAGNHRFLCDFGGAKRRRKIEKYPNLGVPGPGKFGKSASALLLWTVFRGWPGSTIEPPSTQDGYDDEQNYCAPPLHGPNMSNSVKCCQTVVKVVDFVVKLSSNASNPVKGCRIL